MRDVNVKVAYSESKEFPENAIIAMGEIEGRIRSHSAKITGIGEDKVRLHEIGGNHNGFTIRISKNAEESIEGFLREADHFLAHIAK